MNTWKTWKIVLFTILCLALNLGGKFLAVSLSLPLWLDSFGTVQAAYIGGPICGALVGVTGNLAYSTVNRLSLAYSLTSIAIGVIVGIAARKSWFDTFYGFMKTTSLVIVAALIVSVPLNMMFNAGYTGNVMGDALIDYLIHRGLPEAVSQILGQLFIEFPDKLLTLIGVYLWARMVKMRESRKEVPTELSGA